LRLFWKRTVCSSGNSLLTGAFLPKRNYGFEKRQKELTRQRQKEEKKQRKLERSKEAPAENLLESSAVDGTPVEE
jgi:hypothetical protein